VTHHEVVTQPIELAEQTSDPDALLRLAADFRLDRLNVAVAARVLSNPSAPSDAQALCRGDRDVVALDGCSFAAGANLGLAPGEPVVLVFGRDDVYFVVDDEEDLVLSVPVEAVTRVEISGPGRQIKGGGFYGGAGIGGLLGGPQGALDGVLLTTFLNGLSRGATVTSFSRVSGPGWEAIFVNGQREPEQLRQLLSPAFVRVEQAASTSETSSMATESLDLVSSLERLASLVDRGMLTSEDYQVAKSRVLAGE
jgi:hypothetical protein